jgi:23S rRNA pseudouridine2605 synthase
LTAEQLEASRAERMRLNGNGALTFEDARTWIEETGLCLFLPRRQFPSSVAPSFVEAVAGQQSQTADPKHIQLAEELLVRLEQADVAVRLNLLGHPGEHPDFVVASWVLPYVYALRGDRDWRRSPQLTGSRQVSPLAVQVYKLLEAAETNISDLKHALGREVTETAVLRAITELWQQLRIIPVIAAPGVPAKWQLLRNRFQKAIAEGASTSQVTAISVLASIYLQAVIAASMEEVELFLASLTSRSKVREVLRGLVATRQVHTISLGHAPQFYVAGTLPEFAVAPTLYSSATMPANAYFLGAQDEEPHEAELSYPAYKARLTPSEPAIQMPAAPVSEIHPEARAPRPTPARKPASNGKPAASRPHFSRPAASSRDRKPAQSSAGSRPARRASGDARSTSARPSSTRPSSARPSGARPAGSRPAGSRPAGSRPAGARPAAGTRWSSGATGRTGVKQNGNAYNGNGNGHHQNGNGSHPNGNGQRPVSNGARPAARPAASGASRTGKPATSSWSKHNGHGSTKPDSRSNGKPAVNGRSTSAPRTGGTSRPGTPRPDARGKDVRGRDSRTDTRSAVRGSRKPTLAAGAKAGNAKRYGFTAPAKQEKKKQG